MYEISSTLNDYKLFYITQKYHDIITLFVEHYLGKIKCNGMIKIDTDDLQNIDNCNTKRAARAVYRRYSQ